MIRWIFAIPTQVLEGFWEVFLIFLRRRKRGSGFSSS